MRTWAQRWKLAADCYRAKYLDSKKEVNDYKIAFYNLCKEHNEVCDRLEKFQREVIAVAEKSIKDTDQYFINQAQKDFMKDL